MKKYPDSVIARVRAMLPTEPVEGCVEWPMSKTRAGYGQLAYKGDDGKRGTAYAHRAAYIAAFGPIPNGMLVCHKCDNPACFNPAHFFLGDYRDNALDMVAKGRHFCPSVPGAFPNHWSKTRPLRGEDGGNSKITEADAIAIIASAEKGVRLAERYGISPAAVSHIRIGKTWTHLSRDTSPFLRRIRRNRPLES